MATNKLTGDDGYIVLGGTAGQTLDVGVWAAQRVVKLVDVTDSGSGGYEEYLVSTKGSRFQAQVLFDAGTAGQALMTTLEGSTATLVGYLYGGTNSLVGYACTACIEQAGQQVRFQEGVAIAISGRSTGRFTFGSGQGG